MRVLLHLCCGPCGTVPVTRLLEEGINVTGFFYNHNIHPYQEYLKRLDGVRQMTQSYAIPLIERDEYDLETFLAHVAADPASRCDYCYASRLDAAAAAAAAGGFDGFSSSLFYSRYQNHALMKEHAERAAERHQIAFVYRDFRSGWQEGISRSKELGLYRQQYCGCIYSEKERYHPRPQQQPAAETVSA